MGSIDDKLPNHRTAIQALLTDIASFAHDAERQERTLFDCQTDRYAIITQSWKKERLEHHVMILLEIIDGKVWIQADRTDLVVARELEKAGIPKSDIVLGFHPPRVRPLTEYAVA